MAMQNKEIKEVVKPAGCFSRQSKVVLFLPFSACTMWRRVKEGTFPKPQKLSANCTVWSNDELNLWFAEQAEKFEAGEKSKPVKADEFKSGRVKAKGNADMAEA